MSGLVPSPWRFVRAWQSKRYKPLRRPSILCALIPPFGHNWHTSGGIPFEGKDGVFPNGTQHLWCLHCRGEKVVWPWGDRVFPADEKFGYRVHLTDHDRANT